MVRQKPAKLPFLSSTLSATFFYFIKNMLYIVATPIGNLEDISKRALNVLAAVDYILCEDSRRSKILLSAYQIATPLISYHKFNEKKLESKILEDLRMEKNIALISDAGTPLVSDPGSHLAALCRSRSLPMTAIPGACSAIDALVLSGFEADAFQFVGFLPKEDAKKKRVLTKLLFYPGISICFDPANRIVKTLLLLERLCPDRQLFIGRELTKKFEEHLHGDPKTLLAHFAQNEPRGEMVLVIDRGEPSSDITPEETVSLLQEYLGLSLKEAIKAAAKMQKTDRRGLYKKMQG